MCCYWEVTGLEICVCMCAQGWSYNHAGSLRRRPQIMDGGNGWERTGGLPWLQLGKKAHMFVQEHMSPQPIKFSLPVQNNIINRANPVTPYLSLFILVGGCCIMQACTTTKTLHSFHILWIINYCEIHLKAIKNNPLRMQISVPQKGTHQTISRD